MTRRKSIYSTLSLPKDLNKIVFGIIFLVLGVSTIFADQSSVLGNYLTIGLSACFGEYFKYIVSPAFLLFSFLLFKNGINFYFNIFRLFGFVIYFGSLCSIIGFVKLNYFETSYKAYFNVYKYILTYLGAPTTLLTAILLFIFSLVILFRFSPTKFARQVQEKATYLKPDISKIKESFNFNNNFDRQKEYKDKDFISKKSKYNSELEKKKKELDEALALLQKEKEEFRNSKKKIAEENISKKIDIKKVDKNNITEEKKESNFQEIHFGKWQLPSIELLEDRGSQITIDENEVKMMQIEIEKKLLQFGIEVKMKGYKVGPTITQYRLKPADGVKIQKIVNLKDDLKLALNAKNIRIQAPIPGLGVVGIETPNAKRTVVGLREVFEHENFKSDKYEIPLAIGKDTNGDIIIGDLASMPHLLVAGQTASGKSVGVNGFILSMLYKFSPNELKFMLIDPKKVEFSMYNGIPNLLTPVISKMDKTVNALKWGVAEMLRRYELASSIGAKNLLEYNAKVSDDKKWHYIVIVIDELADLMMGGQKKEVEELIIRIAQMGRAAGMHLILATQKPIVKVITGLIKGNVPTRISFTVSQNIDSRTILDKGGAEDLLGKGDMLYSPIGASEPLRVQGVFVSTEEIESIVNQIKLTVDPNVLENLYDPSIVNGKSKTEGSILENYSGDQDEDPEIVEKAILVVKEAGKASTSLIQRKMGLGYGRAAKILDILEELGVVGPANGSKPREVYVD